MRQPLRDFRVTTIAGFSAVIATTVLAMALASYFGRSTNRRLLEIISSHANGVLAMSRVQFEAEHMVASTRGYLITADDGFLEARTRAQHELTASIERLRQNSPEWARSGSLDRIEQLAKDYRTTLDRLLAEAAASGSTATGPAALEEELLPIRTALTQALRDALAAKQARLGRARHAVEHNMRDEERLTLLIGVLGGSLAIAFGWMASRSLQGMYARERAAADRAERAVQARDEMLGVVAHDLRSPLAAIAIKAELLSRKLADPELRARAASIVNVGKRTGVLVQTLLDAASIDAGRFAIQRDHCALAGIVSAIVETFESLAAQKSIELSARLECPAVVLHSDRERMVQALSNLVDNALKFTPPGGRVELRVTQFDACVRLTVRDTGPGISPEHLPRIFERHWSAERASKAGAGLGLYITKAIVEAHAGRIWAASDADGAAFHIELPMMTASPAPAPTAASSATGELGETPAPRAVSRA